MVKIITEADDVLDFVCGINSDPQTSCKMIPAEREPLKEYAEKIIDHENDFIVAVYDKAILKGVFFLLYEPKDKYLELLGSFTKDYIICREFFSYMKESFHEHTFDMVLNPYNKIIIESAGLEGAEFDGEQVEMVLTDYRPKLMFCKVMPFSNEYTDDYKALHDDVGAYWTAEKIMSAKDIFRSYIALIDTKPVGYIDVTYNNSKNEIYNLFIDVEYKWLGYEAALIQTAILNNKSAEMIFLVNTDDTYLIDLCLRLGFKEGAHTIYAKLEL